jgi:hypothetical protein
LKKSVVSTKSRATVPVTEKILLVVDRTLTPAAVNGVSLAVAQFSGTVAGAILTAVFLGKSTCVKTNLAYFIFSLSNFS